MKQVLIITLTLITISCGQQKTEFDKNKINPNQLTSELDSVKTTLNEYESRFKKLEFALLGEYREVEADDLSYYGENYRVEIYLNEIYKTVYITRIEYFGEGAQRITSRKKIDFEGITGITPEQTSSMEFLEWKKFDEFRVKSDEQVYQIKILRSDSFSISEE